MNNGDDLYGGRHDERYHENIEAQKIQRLENGTSAEEPYNIIVGGQLRYVRTDIFTAGDA